MIRFAAETASPEGVPHAAPEAAPAPGNRQGTLPEPSAAAGARPAGPAGESGASLETGTAPASAASGPVSFSADEAASRREDIGALAAAPAPPADPLPAGPDVRSQEEAPLPAEAGLFPGSDIGDRQGSNPGSNRATIKVIGVGGGGGNAVNRMIEAGVRGVEFIVANTDAQVLDRSLAPVRIQIGRDRTGGLGCGGDPEIGRLAARDDMKRLIEALSGADMVFLTVGEGGGTGTGAAPVIACVVQEIEALCVAVATKPLAVEGRRRREVADDGIRELREYVDTLICVPNDRVVEVYGEKPIRAAFRDADDVVRQAVQGISDLIQIPGEINLDFADVRSAMRARGDAVMGIGVASGENRVEEATRAAISSPLLEDTSIRGATSIIVNVTGGESLTLNEVQRAAQLVRDAVALETGDAGGQTEPGDCILLGTAIDPALDDPELGNRLSVTVVATGFPERSRLGATPQDFFSWRQQQATGTHGPEAAAPAEAPAPGPLRRRRTRRTRAASRKRRTSRPSLFADESSERPAATADTGTAVPDVPPVVEPEETGDDRWGDLVTPPYLANRR